MLSKSDFANMIDIAQLVKITKESDGTYLVDASGLKEYKPHPYDVMSIYIFNYLMQNPKTKLTVSGNEAEDFSILLPFLSVPSYYTKNDAYIYSTGNELIHYPEYVVNLLENKVDYRGYAIPLNMDDLEVTTVYLNAEKESVGIKDIKLTSDRIFVQYNSKGLNSSVMFELIPMQ